jgi:hypothetical protein
VIRPPSIGKPLHQHRNGNDIGESNSDSSDDSITQIEPPQLVGRETGEKDAQAVEKPAGKRDDARPFPIQPQAAEETGETPRTKMETVKVKVTSSMDQ